MHILKILLKNLPAQDTKLTHCEEFFNLITSIIRSSGESFIIESDEVPRGMKDLNGVAPGAGSRTIDLSRLIVNQE